LNNELLIQAIVRVRGERSIYQSLLINPKGLAF
jgi:hypothetical protein